MKIKALLITSILCLISSIHTFAQYTFYVYRNDGVINQYVVADIKSIEISNVGDDGDECYIQEIHTIDSISRIPLALIDSISFSAPDPIKSISEAFVDIDWTRSQLLFCDPISGMYSLSYSGIDPGIEEASVVVLDSDTASYVVLVTEVSKNGNIYNIKGELGDISYLFYDTEFTLTTEKDTYNSSPQHKFMTRAAEAYDFEFDDEGMRATGTLWKNDGKEEKTDLYKKENTHAYTKSKFDLNLDYGIMLRFGDKEPTEIRGKKFFKAKNVYVDANVKGSMSAYYDFYLDIEKDETEIELVPNGVDKYALLKHKLFPTIPLKFMVGPVLVKIDLGTDLYADVSLKAEGELHFMTGIDANATMLIGAKYNEQDTSGVVMYNEKPILEKTLHGPTVSGKGKISGKVHLFPRVHAWLYGWAGPSLDIKPYFRADLSGGFQQDLLQSAPSDYCAWSLETFCGLDLAAGLSRSNFFYAYEVWNKSTEDYKALEYSLYKSPNDIQLRSASTDVTKSEITNVEFEVYDKGPDGKNILTPLPQLVKFEGNGEIKSNVGKYGIAKSGVVTASWIPSAANDKLYARLYDIDGNIISEATYFNPIPLPKGDGTAANPFNPAGVNAFIEAGDYKGKEVYITGIICDNPNINPDYGNATFNISEDGNDGSEQFHVYRTMGFNGENIPATTSLKKGNTVVIRSTVTIYNGTYETEERKGVLISVNGKAAYDG